LGNNSFLELSFASFSHAFKLPLQVHLLLFNILVPPRILNHKSRRFNHEILLRCTVSHVKSFIQILSYVWFADDKISLLINLLVGFLLKNLNLVAIAREEGVHDLTHDLFLEELVHFLIVHTCILLVIFKSRLHNCLYFSLKARVFFVVALRLKSFNLTLHQRQRFVLDFLASHFRCHHSLVRQI